MKQYPSIGTKIVPNEYYCLFQKLDGSNIRAEWNNKKGFHKFGSRKRLLDPNSDDILAGAIKLLKQKEEFLTKFLRGRGVTECTMFFEFHGPKSFAGSHSDHLDDMNLTFIDATVNKRGFLKLSDLLDWYEEIGGPAKLYVGPITNHIIEKIRDGSWPGITEEGVIARPVKQDLYGLKTAKIKTRSWLDKVKKFGQYDPDDELDT